MTAARALKIDDWVVHRPNVMRSVAARVPGIDAEEATSRALEKMVRIVSTGGQIDDPAPYWRRAAVNEAISMTREAGRAHPVEDETLDGLTPPVEGAELDAERQADVSMLRTALAGLADDDRQILVERHVHDKAVTDIATGLGVRPHAVTMRLRRAEERLAGAFAAAHAQAVNEPECRTTRAAMHDYLKDRLLPRRRARFETHLDGCAECTRAFVDVREVSWMLRDYGQHVVAAAVATGALGAAVGAGAAGAAGGGAAGAAGAGAPRSFGKKEAAIVAGVLAALAVGGGAMALVANQPDEPPAAQSVPNPGAGGAGGAGGSDAGDGDAGDGDAGDGDAGGDAGDGDAGDGDAGDGDADDGEAGGTGATSGDSTTDNSDTAGDGGSGSVAGPNSRPEEGSGSGAGSGSAPSEGDGDADGESGGDGQYGAEGENDGPNGDGSGTSDGASSDLGAEISDWLASLGFGDGASGGGSGSDTPPGASTADGGSTSRQSDDGTGTDDGAENGTDNGVGSDDGSGSGSGSGSEDSNTGDGGSSDSDGSASADGTDAGIGAEMTSWLARLSTLGIPGFLLIVLLLWLWERWSRTEKG